MENETYEIRKGAIVYKSRPPLDVQIVAYLEYFFGFFALGVSLLLSVGIAKVADPASRRVLLGTVLLGSNSAEAVYQFCMGVCMLFCAWGLMRRAKFAWWFAVLFGISGWIDTALSFSQFSRHPLNMVISIALGIAMFTWLWFRREFYGVHLAMRHRNEPR